MEADFRGVCNSVGTFLRLPTYMIELSTYTNVGELNVPVNSQGLSM
jgi:hypothetical protein